MTDFFEPPPPPPPEPELHRQPDWFGPPEGTLPGVIPLELVLARSDRAAVCITRLEGYPTGFAFELLVMMARRDGADDLLDPLMFRMHHHARGAGGMPDEMLRVGVQFADGGKATNTSGFHHEPEPPRGPVLHPAGGGGGGGSWHQSEWVWPLPPPGPLAFVCEWPAAGIPLTRHEIDAQVILDAASRATVIFPDERAPGGPSLAHIAARPQAIVRDITE